MARMSDTPPPSDAPEPAAGPSTEPTKDDRNLAMLAHLLGIFTWFLGPLLIWLLKKDQSPYIDSQGKEALNFQITIGIAYLAVGVLSCLTLGFGALLGPIIWIVAIIFGIMGAVGASRGEPFRYPIAVRLVK